MLTEEENRFIEYWDQNRMRKKSLLWQLAAGLPLGALIVVAILFNYISGWYKRAELKLTGLTSGGIVIIIALILTVIFIVVFSSRHRWDQNEQRYQELMAKKKLL